MSNCFLPPTGGICPQVVIDDIILAEFREDFLPLSTREDVVSAIVEKAVLVNVGGEPYEGPYTATPTTTQQIFNTKGKVLQNNFVVASIPSNYGLITYNGFEITVS